jgi:hypothetical protein
MNFLDFTLPEFVFLDDDYLGEDYSEYEDEEIIRDDIN